MMMMMMMMLVLMCIQEPDICDKRTVYQCMWRGCSSRFYSSDDVELHVRSQHLSYVFISHARPQIVLGAFLRPSEPKFESKGRELGWGSWEEADRVPACLWVWGGVFSLVSGGR